MTLGDNSEGGAIFAFYYAYSGDYDALGITTLNNSIVAGNMSVDSDADDILSETATVANGVNIVGSGSDTDASGHRHSHRRNRCRHVYCSQR